MAEPDQGTWSGGGLEIAYRESLPDSAADAPVVLFVHGYPTSSYLWRAVLPAAAEAGYRALALDLPGFGDSPPVRPGSWEAQVEAVEAFRRGLGLEQLVLGVHDWGGLIGLRWACDHPGAATALILTDTGFFPDGRWHGMARVLSTPGQGEQALEAITRDLFGQAMEQISPGLPAAAADEYFKAYADADRKTAQLELYRSGDFSKIEPYDGKLAALGVPALVLWGERDEFAPVGGAHRFGRLPGARKVLLPEAGHFLMEDDPERVAAEVRSFLESLA